MKSTKYQKLMTKVAELEEDIKNMEKTYNHRIHQLRVDRVHKRRERVADAAVIALLLWSASGFLWAFMGFAEWLMR